MHLKLASIFILVLWLSLVSRLPAAGIDATRTVFIILMENHNWAQIKGNASAAYINNTLLPMASYTDQYYNPPSIHPSEPNYLWLEAGTNFGILNDNLPSINHQSTTAHFVTQLNTAGISWTSYQEDISGSVCPLTNVNKYAPKHNPMVFFDDVTNTNNANSAYCIANVRPYSELATDLANQTVTHYNFITPNLCNDMHDSTGCATTDSVLNGDNWLANNLPTILNSNAYKNNGAIFITWDEGEGGDGPIGMIILSPLAKGAGYHNAIAYTHSSALRTFQKIFGTAPLLGGAATAIDLSDLFVVNAIPNADAQVLVTSITETPGVSMVTCTSQPGLAYRLQWKNHIGDTWNAVTPDKTGTGGALTWIDNGTSTGSAPSGQRFYRVIIP